MMHRKRFIEWLLGIGGAGTTVMVAYPLVKFVNSPPRSSEGSAWLDAGSAAELPEGATKTVMNPAGLPLIIINRGNDGIVALEKRCPHLGCMVNLAGGILVCPCHGAKFTLDGTLISGPSPRSLKQFAVKLPSSGNILIGKELG